MRRDSNGRGTAIKACGAMAACALTMNWCDVAAAQDCPNVIEAFSITTSTFIPPFHTQTRGLSQLYFSRDGRRMTGSIFQYSTIFIPSYPFDPLRGTQFFAWTPVTGFHSLSFYGGAGVALRSASADAYTLLIDIDYRAQEGTGTSSQVYPPVAGAPPITLGGFYTTSSGISGNGSTVVGVSNLFETAFVPSGIYRWTAVGGAQNLGTIAPGENFGAPDAISFDGSVLAGGYSAGGVPRGWRWTAALGMHDIGTIPGAIGVRPLRASADGGVIVGVAQLSATTSALFRWTEATGMQNLGSLGSGVLLAGISDDGAVIAGSSSGRAIRWTAATGLVAISPEDATGATATGISADGNVIVGSHIVAGVSQVFRWTNAGGFRSIGTGAAPAVDAIGQRVAWRVSRDGTERVLRWRTADLNADGVADPDDLAEFVNCYFQQMPCPTADFGDDGQTNADDLGDYINAYFGGCP